MDANLGFKEEKLGYLFGNIGEKLITSKVFILEKVAYAIANPPYGHKIIRDFISNNLLPNQSQKLSLIHHFDG